jgi:hypothetical protein
VSYQRVYRKGMLMRGRLMEVQAWEEVRCMLKRSACRGTKKKDAHERKAYGGASTGGG